MCGISGFINYKSPDAENLLKQMIGSLAHRGPDGEGVYLDRDIGFAHRRLAIIDLAGGEQPMFSPDKRFVTTFNGEIYNYLELKKILVEQGCNFHSNSDTEVIAEAIRAWGIKDACTKFRGMFAFAVYDFQEKVVYLGRDHLGIKPLYYSFKNNACFFASEQKAILKIPEISRHINHVALHDFLTLGFPVTSDTCWRDIQMFPPAHYMIIKPDNPQKSIPERYWKWSLKPEPISEYDASQQLEAVLKDSLKYHLRSDVPLAAFLSGGIDSSLLVRFLKEGLVDQIKTFNVGFPEDEYDESQAARTVADICETEHHQIRIDQANADPELFETVMAQYDEPYGDSSCLPTYLVASEMRKHVKTVISGDGGDELFGGYGRFRTINQINMINALPAKKLFSPIVQLLTMFLNDDHRRKLQKAFYIACQPQPTHYCWLHTYFSEEERQSIYADNFSNLISDSGNTWERMNRFLPDDSDNPGELLAGLELALNVHADYLRKVDIASSAHGLEVRVPFLDIEVMNFSAKLPFDYKVHGNECKFLLREIVRKRISPAIGNKQKGGFGIPFDNWCGGEVMLNYMNDLLFSKKADQGIWQIFRKQVGEDLWKMFTSNRKRSYKDISRLQIYQRVFMLASMQIWMNRFNPEF